MSTSRAVLLRRARLLCCCCCCTQWPFSSRFHHDDVSWFSPLDSSASYYVALPFPPCFRRFRRTADATPTHTAARAEEHRAVHSNGRRDRGLAARSKVRGVACCHVIIRCTRSQLWADKTEQHPPAVCSSISGLNTQHTGSSCQQ